MMLADDERPASGLNDPAQTTVERRAAPQVARPFGRRALDQVDLTARQQQVLELVAHGDENKEIAAKLGITEQAVKQQVSVLLRKFDVPSRAALTQAAVTMKVLGSRPVSAEVPLAYLFDRAPLLIAITRGSEHRFVAANHAYEEFFDARDWVGRTVADFPWADAAVLSRLDQTYRSGETYRSSEQHYRLPGPEGRPTDRYLSMIREAIRGPDGSVEGLAFYAWEVTEEVRLRRRLQQLSVEQEVLLEQLPVGVIYVDAQARPRLVNGVARRILGQALDPARSLYEQAGAEHVRFAADGRRVGPENLPSARATKGWPFDDDVILRRPDGTDVRVHVSARPLHDGQGAVTGATLVMVERGGPSPAVD